jgi:hypothetical protein
VNLKTSPEELFTLIGEREFIKYKQQQKIAELYAQIDEMAKTISKLHEELNGRLGKSADNDAIRRVCVGGESSGRGCGDDVLERAVEPTHWLYQAGSSAD